ncbi:MAG: DUF6782 family putative metallopeptidase [Pseudomonadota bacterium]|nr:DUF6782 family putative metallopeptidase [Pseudomonadota bacterium]
MSVKMSRKDLKKLIEKLFSIERRDKSFFCNILFDIASTDLGTRLLCSLGMHFDGKKVALKTNSMLTARGYFSDEKSEIVIKKQSADFLPHRQKNYSKILFHELTHWDQFLNQATGGHALLPQDKFFTVMVAEADAQSDGDLFEIEQRSSFSPKRILLHPVTEFFKLVTYTFDPSRRFVAKTKSELQKNHPDWSVSKVLSETRKTFFTRTLTDSNAQWHQFYKDPKIVEQATSGTYSKRKQCDLMKYYMDKYGLTWDECLHLQKEVLAHSDYLCSSLSRHKNTEKINSFQIHIPIMTNILSHTSEMQPLSLASRGKVKPLDSILSSRRHKAR